MCACKIGCSAPPSKKLPGKARVAHLGRWCPHCPSTRHTTHTSYTMHSHTTHHRQGGGEKLNDEEMKGLLFL